ncbi:sulfatase-like hydrolase/transferase, partial [Bacteroidota bacterium]
VIRYNLLKIAIACIYLVAIQCTAPKEAPLSEKPNIILCMSDDQGWGDMGYNGHPVLKTPNFDKVASTALRFDRFYSASSVCSPTRASFMTGRDPNRTGCKWIGNYLRPQEISIAEALKTAGYKTAHYGKWHIGSIRKGSPVNPGAFGFDEWLSASVQPDNDPALSREGTAVQFQGEGSMVLVDAALEFINRQVKSSNPFLVVIWFGSPHVPHIATKQDLELYKDIPENPTLYGYSHGLLSSHTSDRFPDLQEELKNFYGEITAMDRAFGKLREELRTLQIHENTILWFTSDNGAIRDIGRSGGRGCKGDIYEGGVLVPGLLEWPAKIKQPTVTNIPCNIIDIYPTVLDIAGVEMKNQPVLDGISLLPLLEGKMKSRPKPMGFWIYNPKDLVLGTYMHEYIKEQEEGLEPDTIKFPIYTDAAVIKKHYPEDRFPGWAAWNDWPWKLHRSEKESGEIDYKLFNLIEDPLEENDLSKIHTEHVTTMNSEMEKWQKSVLFSLNGKDY